MGLNILDCGQIIVIVIISLLSIEGVAGGQMCYECKSIPEPHDCEVITECLDGEQCYTDYYITPQGHVFYDLGCEPDRVCNALNSLGRKRSIGKRQDGNLHLCEECCNTRECNRHSCADNSNYQNRTICYDCPDVVKVTDCDKVTVCKEGNICVARKQITELWEERWSVGCETERQCEALKHANSYGHPVQTPVVGKRDKQIASRQSGLFPFIECLYCCKDNYCNHKECQKGAAATTKASTTTTRTTAKPHPTTQRHTTKSTTTVRPVHHTATTKTTHKTTTTHIKATTKHTTPTTRPTTTTTKRASTTRKHNIATHRPTTTTTKHTTTTTKRTTHTTRPTTTTTRRTTKKHITTTTTRPTTTTKHQTTTPSGLTCNYCTFANHEDMCNHTTVCNPGEQCYLARVDGDDLNDYHCFYSLGCMSKSDCNSYRHDIAMHGTASTVFGENYEYLECCDNRNSCNEHTIVKKPAHCTPATEPPPAPVG